MRENGYGDPSPWFRVQCGPHMSERDVVEKWITYNDFKSDGYSWGWIKVHLGLADSY